MRLQLNKMFAFHTSLLMQSGTNVWFPSHALSLWLLKTGKFVRIEKRLAHTHKMLNEHLKHKPKIDQHALCRDQPNVWTGEGVYTLSSNKWRICLYQNTRNYILIIMNFNFFYVNYEF